MMALFQRLTPDYIYDDIFAIDLAGLSARGVRALFFDIDNTLTEWNVPEVDERTYEWFQDLRAQGFCCCLISNNKGRRAQTIASQLGVEYVSGAAKPLSRGFLRAFKLLNVEPEQTALIGDQLFTDVWGGNRVGVTTVLVKQLGPNEHWGTRNFFRRGERLVRRQVDKNYRKKQGSR